MTAPPPPIGPDGLRLSGAPLDTARRVLVVAPGALTRLDIFSPLTDRLPAGTALVELAFPGVDGRPLDRPVRVRATARRLAERLNTSPAMRIDLVGLSAGAAICFELRGRLTCPNVTLAVIAAPAPAPALLTASARMSRDLLRIRRAHRGAPWHVVWFEMFQILLFGRTEVPPKLPVDTSGRPAGPTLTPTPKLLAYHGLGTALWRPSRRAMKARTPLRFFHGRRDTVSPARALERFVARLPGAEITWYEDRGHLAHVFNPALFEAIRRFWAEARG